MTKVALGKYGESLVPNLRLEKVFYQLQRLTNFPDGLEFTTQLQEPHGTQEAQAVFMITSPHPSPAKTAMIPPKIVSIAVMPYHKWKNAEAEQRHYAFLADPLRPIFAGLLRQHLAKRKNLEGLE